MKKYFGFLIVLTLFVLGGTQAHAAASVPGPCALTATPSITLISPNGGEVYQSGQQITVKWTSCNSLDSQIIISLKSTQSVYGSEIATVNNTGSATVTLPVVLGGQGIPLISGNYYKIIVQLGGNGMGHIAPTDSSDNTFTIKSSSSEEAPYIKVVSPNGGEKIDISNPVTVTFKSNNPAPAKHYINLVDVNEDHAYSLDSLLGSNGLTLTQAQINQSIQSITVSAPESLKLNTTHDYLIEICVKNICDKSDSTFKLVKTNLISVCGTSKDPSLKILSPNGGEIYKVGQKIPVKWTSCNIPSTATIATVFSYVDGNDIGEIVHNSGAQSLDNVLNTGNTMITPPASFLNILGKHFKIKLVYSPGYANNPNGINASDSSDDTFYINPASPIDDDGCSNSEKYSSTNGQICTKYGCLHGEVYSSTTGMACPVKLIEEDKGCSKGEIYSSTTGKICVIVEKSCSTDGSCIPQVKTTLQRNLKIGVKGEDVKIIQKFLGLNTDGVFGKKTAEKVKEWQMTKNLKADGIVGNKTMSLMK